MTNDELNELIAKAKGNEYPRGYYLPNYTSDWRLAGALLEEMPSSNLLKHPDGHWTYWYIGAIDFCSAGTPQRAICEAYAKWKGLI